MLRAFPGTLDGDHRDPGGIFMAAQAQRITLDRQLVAYWAREATRLEALAAGARFGWQKRRFLRKADHARAMGARSGAREADRATISAETG